MGLLAGMRKTRRGQRKRNCRHQHKYAFKEIGVYLHRPGRKRPQASVRKDPALHQRKYAGEQKNEPEPEVKRLGAAAEHRKEDERHDEREKRESDRKHPANRRRGGSKQSIVVDDVPEGDVEAAPVACLKSVELHENRNVRSNEKSKAKDEREEHPPARHEREMLFGIGVDIELPVHCGGKRKSLDDIVDADKEKADKSLSGEDSGEDH